MQYKKNLTDSKDLNAGCLILREHHKMHSQTIFENCTVTNLSNFKTKEDKR